MKKNKEQIVNEALLSDSVLIFLNNKLSELYSTIVPRRVIYSSAGISYKLAKEDEELIERCKEEIYYRKECIIDFFNEKFGNVNVI